MNIIILVEPQHEPIPSNIKIEQDFGYESLRTEEGRVTGNSMILSGSPQDFAAWLKPFDGVWITSNPMIGNWEVVHVIESLDF